MTDDLDFVLACHREQTYDDPARLLRLAHDEESGLEAAAIAALVDFGDPELHTPELVAVADVATRDVALLADDWAEFAAEHDLDATPPLVHTALAALRRSGDPRYPGLVAAMVEGGELERLAALLALGDDPRPEAEALLRREVAETGDDAATASLLNQIALTRSTSWTRTAAALHVEDGWSRRQAASFLRVAGELIADSEDLTQYDDLVELAEDDSLPRGLRRFALGYALSFDLEPEDEKQAKLQRAHVRRVTACSKAGIVPLVETEVPAWFRGRVDVAVLD